MFGTIRCAKCGKKREGGVCPKCGAYTCYISIYWRGKHWKFWRSPQDNHPLDYVRAAKQLINMESSLSDKEKKFTPHDWLPAKVKECTLGNQAICWLEQKKQEAEKGELSYETLKNYKGYVSNYFSKSFLADMDVREIDYKEILEFKDQMPNSIKLKTRRNILNALHGFFRQMRKERIITSMPEFPSIEGEDAEVRVALTIEEQRGGLAKIPLPHKDIIEFGFETGLRPGETCALKIGDINLNKQEMVVQRTWSGAALRETTKGKNKLHIPLSDRAYHIAKSRIKERFDKNLFLFVNPETSRPYRPKKLNQLWQEHSGLPCSHYEASRHSFCTQIVETEGVDISTAQRLMRHKDIKSTMAYIHTTPARLKGVVNRRGKPAVIGTTAERVNEQ